MENLLITARVLGHNRGLYLQRLLGVVELTFLLTFFPSNEALHKLVERNLRRPVKA
jgi:hypothetical protein